MALACRVRILTISIATVAATAMGLSADADAAVIAGPARERTSEALEDGFTARSNRLRHADTSATGLTQSPTQSRTVTLLVRTAGAATLQVVVAAARRARLVVRHQLRPLRTVSVRVPIGRAAAVMKRLQGLPGVTEVAVAGHRHLSRVPNDPRYTNQASYLAAVRAPTAWNSQRGSSSVKIAIVDSGVDVDHPDLAAKVVASRNVLNNSSNVSDSYGHGTFVAGIAAAGTNNRVGVAGAGYRTSLMAVKVSRAGTVFIDDEAAGILWATDHGADVINLSIGGPQSDRTERSAVAYAQSHGVLVVAAAGNAGTNVPNFPAAYRGVVAVGATDGAGRRASFSSFGWWVTLAAPGTNIYSTAPPGSHCFPNTSGYARGSGTSFSAPIVSGAAALLLSRNRAQTRSDLRRALVASAHGYLGRRLGAGQVDFARALAHVIPTSAPTRLNVHGSAGRLRLAAGSTARAVAFRVDGGPRLGPVPVVFGAASLRWPSWGYANGWHRVTAVDCTAYRECARTSTSVTFKIANAAPVVSAPTRGSTITGGFTVKASSTGGGLRLIIDGRAHGFDRTAPYTLAYTGSALSQGWHTLYVRQCSRDRRHCLGPASLGVPFRSNSLRPTIVSVSPSVFSPNGDGRRDTTTVTYTLPIEQTVQVSVVNRLGLTIHGRQLGTQRKGLHTWVWKGDGIAGLRAANGRYSLRINTSKVVSGVTVRGSVSRIVRLDTIAPHLSAVTGSGASFFPYRDGYRDTFEPAARLDEGGTLTLRIRDSAGRLVRSLSAAKASGPVSLSWNGHTDSGAPAAAGRYRWNFTVTDQAANRRQSWTWSVSLSWQRLVAKRATLTRDGDAYYATGAPPCAVVDESTSSYDDGVDLLNGCSYEAEGDQVAKASYRFALPDAPVYFRMSVRAYGFSSHWPAELRTEFLRPDGTASSFLYENWTSAEVSPETPTVAVAGNSSATQNVEVGVAVTNYYVDTYGVSSFQLDYLTLTVTYGVLE